MLQREREDETERKKKKLPTGWLYYSTKWLWYSWMGQAKARNLAFHNGLTHAWRGLRDFSHYLLHFEANNQGVGLITIARTQTGTPIWDAAMTSTTHCNRLPASSTEPSGTWGAPSPTPTRRQACQWPHWRYFSSQVSGRQCSPMDILILVLWEHKQRIQLPVQGNCEIINMLCFLSY